MANHTFNLWLDNDSLPTFTQNTARPILERETFAARSVWFALILVALVLCTVTVIFTSLRAVWAIHFGSKHGGKPPTAPCFVPFIGHTMSFVLDTSGFMKSMAQFFGDVPFRLNLVGETVYYIPHGDVIHSWFTNSRHQTTQPFLIAASRDALGLSLSDMEILARDGSGENRKPAPGYEHIHPDHRLFYTSFRDARALLTGPALDSLAAQFIAYFTRRLQSTVEFQKDEWTGIPDLYIWFRDMMFCCVVETFCGEHLLSLNPDFVQEFWTFSSYFHLLLRRPPRWLAPKAYHAREKAVESVRRWREHAAKHSQQNGERLTDSIGSDPYWGSPLMRGRSIMLKKGGFSEDGAARLDLGMIFATSANLVTATFWALFGIHGTDPSVIPRIRDEISPCFNPTTGGLVHLKALTKKPLLGSVCNEALRYSVNTMPAAKTLVPDLKIGKWTIPEKNVTMISMARHGSYDPAFWNQGRPISSPSTPTAQTQYEHPVDTFWAERFLEYDDDQKFHGHFFPYGRGVKMCPGRFFSNKAMAAAIAIAMNEFDFELDPNAVGVKVPKPDTRCLPGGTLPPDRCVPGRIRRRPRRGLRD
ncbi:Cytochrome P450 [Naviculisporaceae sp. PSN 640]